MGLMNITSLHSGNEWETYHLPYVKIIMFPFALLVLNVVQPFPYDSISFLSSTFVSQRQAPEFIHSLGDRCHGKYVVYTANIFAYVCIFP